MHWTIPEYSRSDVNRAGRILIGRDNSKSFAWAFRVLNNWRSSHSYPVNTFQATLRARLKRLKIKGLVSQRLKRLPSIQYKLSGNPTMNLARMHDIGGLRAVVENMRQADRLVDYYWGDVQFPHEPVDIYDYIAKPKESGYRSVHLVYKYMNPRADAKYHNLRIEIQVRSKIQHAWATAVETIGTFLDFALKSGDGPTKWLNFFRLAGSAFAYYEGYPPVPGLAKLSEAETYSMVLSQAEELNVRDRLMGFSVAANKITQELKGHSLYIVILNLDDRTVMVEGFGRAKQADAAKEFGRIEERVSQGERLQAVLVGADSIKELRKAYPSYFLDSQMFLRYLRNIERVYRQITG